MRPPSARWPRLAGLALVLLVTTPALHAHRPYEVTTVGRLQHGRLELTLTLSPVMVNYLLRSDASSEAAPFSPETVDLHRETLLRLAPRFLQLRGAGDEPMLAEKVLLSVNSSGEPEFFFVFPQPAGPTLRIRADTLRAPGREGFNVVRVFDSDETLLGSGILGAEPQAPEVSIPLSGAPARP
jgi:hypothetical protein